MILSMLQLVVSEESWYGISFLREIQIRSYGIEGFLIEDGKLTQPVNEMNVTGNMVTLWNSLVAVGNDPQPNRSWQIPSLVFEGVDFSGL